MDEPGVDYKYFKIAKPADVPDGERLYFDLNGNPVVLFSISGEFFATGDLCSHDQGPIGDGEIEGDVIICPRHGARFDIHTGKALTMPAVVGIPVYPVRIKDEYIEVGIPI